MRLGYSMSNHNTLLAKVAQWHSVNSIDQVRLALQGLGTTEDALALVFAQLHADEFRYSHGMDWLYFDGGRWVRDHRLRRYAFARLICRAAAQGAGDKQAARLESASTVNAVLSLARSDSSLNVAADAWDANGDQLNTPGGMVDLRTGEIRRTLANDLVTKITSTAPEAGPALTWQRFLFEVFEGDTEVIAFLQVLLGYYLTGCTREHKVFFCYGKGANGKSTLVDLVLWLLGDYALKLPANVLMQSKHTAHPTELAQLQGRRLAISSEIEDGQYWAEARIKELTGDEMLSARFMRQDYFEFRQTQKHLIAGNYRPRLRGGDSAMQRRMVLIPFNASFEGAAQDKTLSDKLRAEGAQILAWMIQGAVKWYSEGLTIPPAIQVASAEYMSAMDDLAEWVEDCCEVGATFREPSRDLFASFAAWKRERGEQPPSIKAWIERVRQQLGLDPYRNRRERGVQGISLTIDEKRKVSGVNQHV